MERFLQNRFNSHKHLMQAIIPVVLLAAGGIGGYAYIKTRPVSVEDTKTESKQEVDLAETAEPQTSYTVALNGEETFDRQRLNAPINAFVISNSKEARPQSGLSTADVVFEFLAENSATRFLALYQGDIPQNVGPLRSLRPYFSDVTLGFDANISHVGGSEQALGEVGSLGLKSLNEFSNENYYYRSSDRVAPHNLYTTNELINSVNDLYSYTSSSYDPWLRSQDPDDSGDVAETIDIKLSSDSTYNPIFYYNSETDQYPRSLDGFQHFDRNNDSVIAPSVIISIKAPHTVLDSAGRLGIDLVGDGEATVFQKGKAIEATWKKDSRSSNFVFLDNGGEEIKLNSGQTWIAVSPVNTSVSYF